MREGEQPTSPPSLSLPSNNFCPSSSSCKGGGATEADMGLCVACVLACLCGERVVFKGKMLGSCKLALDFK